MIELIGSPEIIISNKNSQHHYFAWPTATRLRNGQIAVGASGYRLAHICPFGKAVLCLSDDEGETFSQPKAVIDTVLDDRDAGLCPFGESGLILTSFNNTVDFQRKHGLQNDYCRNYLDSVDPEEEKKALGSTFRISHDNGKTFGEIFHSPVSSPHGPIQLSDSTVLWVGSVYEGEDGYFPDDIFIKAYTLNTDTGEMSHIGTVEPVYSPVDGELLLSSEPYVAELSEGTLICHFRAENQMPDSAKVFTVYQTESHDKGVTWTKPHRILSECGGAPSHLLVHSSGLLIATYGYREFPYGIRAMTSFDSGNTWNTNQIIYNNEISDDIGYPSTVELPDGSLLTVFYACPEKDDYAVIMKQKWKINGIDNLYFESWHKDMGYTHTAELENGVVIHAFADGTAFGLDGKKYRVATHLDEDDDVVVDGWEIIE